MRGTCSVAFTREVAGCSGIAVESVCSQVSLYYCMYWANQLRTPCRHSNSIEEEPCSILPQVLICRWQFSGKDIRFHIVPERNIYHISFQWSADLQVVQMDVMVIIPNFLDTVIVASWCATVLGKRMQDASASQPFLMPFEAYHFWSHQVALGAVRRHSGNSLSGQFWMERRG